MSAEEDSFVVKRVRVLAKVLGCEDAVPDDATTIGCLGTVLGSMRFYADCDDKRHEEGESYSLCLRWKLHIKALSPSGEGEGGKGE